MHGLIPILTGAVENNSCGFQWFKDAEDGVKVKINTSLLQPVELHLNSVLSNQKKLLHYLYSAGISAFWKKSTKLCVCVVIHVFFWSYILALPSLFFLINVNVGDTGSQSDSFSNAQRTNSNFMYFCSVLTGANGDAWGLQNWASFVWHNSRLVSQFHDTLNIGVVHFRHHLTYRIMLLCYGLKAIKAAELEV